MSSSRRMQVTTSSSRYTDNATTSSTSAIAIRLHLDGEAEDWFIRLKSMWNLCMDLYLVVEFLVESFNFSKEKSVSCNNAA